MLENMDRLLPHVQVASFTFAQSRNEMRPVDIAFVEGSVSQPHDIELLKKIRSNCRWLVAVGSCAIRGCVQRSACRTCSPAELVRYVYGEGSPIEATPACGLDQYVRVDVKLPGCPINATQFLAVTASLLKDHLPYITHKPVCLECKLAENCCVLIESDLPCLGPITAAGCGALCPSLGAACYGCWGPCEDPQIEAMATVLNEKGYELEEIIGRLGAFGMPDELLARAQPLSNKAGSK